VSAAAIRVLAGHPLGTVVLHSNSAHAACGRRLSGLSESGRAACWSEQPLVLQVWGLVQSEVELGALVRYEMWLGSVAWVDVLALRAAGLV
jgi:hypothetical protein